MNGKLKLNILYLASSVVIYVAFWIGIYFLQYYWALIISGIAMLGFGIFFVIYNKKTLTALLCCLGLSFSIGLCMSSVFTVQSLVPSKFVGLILLGMVAYKTIQLSILQVVKSKVLQNVINIVDILIEIAFIIFACTFGFENSIKYQLLIVAAVGIFLSFGIIVLCRINEADFWRTAAICYFIGFIMIFVLAILLVISIIAEDGAPFEFFGEFIAGDLSTENQTKKKKLNKLMNK